MGLLRSQRAIPAEQSSRVMSGFAIDTPARPALHRPFRMRYGPFVHGLRALHRKRSLGRNALLMALRRVGCEADGEDEGQHVRGATRSR